MNEQDYEALRQWLVDHKYYVGNSEVAESLRKLANEWNDKEYIEMMELLYGLNFMINSNKIKSSDIHKAIEIVKKQNKRASGRSSRILNSIIEEFFQKPLGIHVMIYDHSTNKNDVKIMINNIKKRLKNEYPHIKYRIGYELENPYIMRIE